jgi:hypothetical protein
MRWRILVSLLSLAIICFGVGYAVGRERLRDPDHLHALYQETNKEFFGGQLPDVEVKSHDLLDEDAAGITYEEMKDRFVIVLDPKRNTSENEALPTMRHEACHVATWNVMDPNDVHGDVHGPPFQECMKRFAHEE